MRKLAKIASQRMLEKQAKKGMFTHLKELLTGVKAEKADKLMHDLTVRRMLADQRIGNLRGEVDFLTGLKNKQTRLHGVDRDGYIYP